MISTIILCLFTLSLAAPKPVLYCNDTSWKASTVAGAFPDDATLEACKKPTLTKGKKISEDDWSAVECSGKGDEAETRGSCEDKNIEVPAQCLSLKSCNGATFNGVTTCAGLVLPEEGSCEGAECKDCIKLTCGDRACKNIKASTTKKASNETEVFCIGDEACTPLANLDVHAIDCNGEKACYQAKALKAENIKCEGVNACGESDLSIQETLACTGEAACKASTIKIAKNKGKVVCDGPNVTPELDLSLGLTELTEAALDAALKDAAAIKAVEDLFGGVTTEDGFKGTSCAEATIKFSNLFLNEGSATCTGAGSCYNAKLNVPTTCAGMLSCYGAQMGDDFDCIDSDFDCYGTSILKGSGVTCCGNCAVAGKADGSPGCTLEADKKTIPVESSTPDVFVATEFACKQCGKKSLFFLATSSKTAMIVAIVICLLLLGVAVGVLIKFKEKIFGGGSTEEV